MSAPLLAFGAYCRRMSTALHTDDCASLAKPSRPRWRVSEDYSEMRLVGWTPTPPPCDGCVNGEDRELWTQLADEIDAHLDHPAATLEGLL